MAGCSAVQTADTSTGYALLTVDCRPPHAEVWIDERYMGALTDLRENTLPLAPGRRRIEIGADGYYPYRRDLNAGDGRSYRLVVDLLPDLGAMDDNLDKPRVGHEP